MDWNNVLVTGASGLLGAELSSRLVSCKANVVCLIRDNLEYTRLRSVPCTAVHGDVRDSQLIRRVLAEYEIETVFHLAAQPIVGVASRNPAETFDVNAMGTVSVLEACRQVPVKRVVVASTDKVYGVSDVPCDENSPLNGKSPYEASKVCTDVIAQSYARQYGMAIGIARCGNLYGPGDLNWSRLIPGTVRSIIRNEAVIIRSDGTPVHDYFYVADAAGAYMALAKHLDRPGAQVFNFGGGGTYSVKEVLRYIQGLMSDNQNIIYMNDTQLEIPYQALVLDKAKNELNWVPKWILLDGLRPTINWYREYLKSR